MLKIDDLHKLNNLSVSLDEKIKLMERHLILISKANGLNLKDYFHSRHK